MPLREHKEIADFNTYVGAPEPEKPEPSWGETFGAAFRMENDVMAAADLMSRPTYEAEEGYDNKTWLQENGFWDDYRDNFAGSRSTQESLSIAERIRREEEDRETLQRAGFGGLVAAIGAGVLSPTMFIPLVAGGRGAVAFGRAGMLALGASAAQELPLQAAQETRTLEETAFALGAGTILGGLLGGSVQVLGKNGLRDLTQAFSRDMASSTVEYTIPSTVGAASPRRDAGKFASSLGTIDAMKKLSPVMRTIQQNTSPVARWMMTQLSDAGLVLSRNVEGVPTAELGTVENLTKTWYGRYAKAVEAIDENYNSFVFDGNVPSFAANSRAVARGTFQGGEKSKASFREAIGRAMREGDQSENPYVAKAAKAVRQEIYEPLLKEAQARGILPDELDLKGDISYIFRDYDRSIINARYGDFIKILAGHFEKKLLDDFVKKADNFKKAAQRDEELIEAMRMKPEEVEPAREAYQTQLRDLEEGANVAHLNALEETVAALRASARELRGAGEEAQRRQMLRDARDMEKAAGEDLEKLRANRADVRRRLRNLNKAQVVLEKKAAAKVEKAERAEDLSLGTLKRLVNKATKILKDLDRLSDKEFDKQISELKTAFARTADQFDRGEERIAKLADDEGDAGRILKLDETQRSRADRLTAIVEQLDEAENLDRADIRAIVEDGLNEALTKAQGIVQRRAVRNARLLEAAKKIAPEDLEKRIAEVREGRVAKQRDIEESLRLQGAEEFDITSSTANFKKKAEDDAKRIADKIRGVHLRLPAFEIMQGERGAELARVLDIPSRDIEDFLVNDVEKLSRSYLRTMAPDIEIARKFGSVNAEEQFIELVEEENQKKLAIQEEIVRNRAEKKLPPLGEEELQKEVQKRSSKISDEYAGYRRDLAAVIGRLRHTWGLPDDPDALSYRMGRFAMNLNVLRMMGSVAVSSIPDIARPVMKYGIVRTFRDGYLPFITNMKKMQVAKRELKLAGGALDVILHSRAMALFDIMDDLGRGSKFERATEYATHRMGIIALFDHWTKAMKQMTGAVANVRILDALESVTMGKGNVTKNTEYLASLGIDGARAKDMWEEVLNGGGQKVDGVWMPDTELWRNPDNVRAMRSALLREVDNAIVTPGVERSLWVDKSMTGRMLAQFKSFAMSSTSKTLLSGMQQRDMAFMQGVAISLALGALSYYIWARTVGGDAEQEMLNAGLDKWADEMIDRSGLLAILAEVQRFGERIPTTAPYVRFSGEQTTRRGGGGLAEAALGPSFDLALDAGKLLTEMDDPTQSTLHTLRTMTPLQNVWYLRRGFDAIEEGAGEALNLPENRR